MGTAIKHPVPDRVKPSFVIVDIRALWRSGLSVRVPRCQKLHMTTVATVDVKGLSRLVIQYIITRAAIKQAAG